MDVDSRVPVRPAHRLLSEMGPARQAKANLKELANHKAAIGQCVERARKSLGWSQKELADALGVDRDVAQVSRWESGKERPQFDVLWAVEALRGPLVIQLASLSEAIAVETTITIKRAG